MKLPLSIFSFDTLKGPLKIPRAVFWTVLMLLTIRLAAFALTPVVEHKVNRLPRKEVVQAGTFLKANRDKNIRVLFFGSSRIKSGVLTDRWTGLSGMPEESAMNLAISSGTFQNAISIIEKAGGLPDTAELAFVSVDPVLFNKNRLYPERDKPARIARGKLNTLWPIAWRRPVIDWVRGMIGTPGSAPATLSPPVYHVNKEQKQRLANSYFFSAASMGPLNFHAFEISPRALYDLKSLTALLKRKSIRVVLVHPPFRAGYFAPLKDDAIRDEYQALIGQIRTLAARDMEFIYWEKSADCGLDDSVFVDFGHFSKEGAARFTRKLHEAVVG